jgi:hypothetical protein
VNCRPSGVAAGNLRAQLRRLESPVLAGSQIG